MVRQTLGELRHAANRAGARRDDRDPASTFQANRMRRFQFALAPADIGLQKVVADEEQRFL
jgi:hypothetical protein